MRRDDAVTLLHEMTETPSLRRHARTVEIVMRALAERHEEDAEEWGNAGLLHDADYEKWPEDHPNRIVAWLRERAEEELAYAISAHYTQWNVPCKTQLDKALLACDELTGFIVACCLVRPEGVSTLKSKSVRKKLKDKAFAAKVDRVEVHAGAELLEVEIAEHIDFIIEALKPHAVELGIEGRNLKDA